MHIKNVLVTGANGQLGQCFMALRDHTMHNYLFADRQKLDIADVEQVQQFFTDHQIDICINCAAYTAVDMAEQESDRTFLINESGVRNLALASAEHDVLMIQISTDYVYDSTTTRPLLESDRCRPRGVYARSKYAGEQALISAANKWIIFRVSWLYSPFATNFVKTMLRLGSQRDKLSVVSDQIGTPTYAPTFAAHLMEIMEEGRLTSEQINQIYNYSNTGITHWAAFAKTIFKYANIKCEIQEISTREFGAPAPRPLWSVMDKSKITETLGINIPHWESDLQLCLTALNLSA